MLFFGNKRTKKSNRTKLTGNERRRMLKIESLERRQLMAVLTVTNTNDSGAGSLRQAIETAESNATTDEIKFNIAGGGVKTISLSTALPFIFDPVAIDGWSQPGFTSQPLIKLLDVGGVDYGLQIIGNNVSVRGMIFSGFDNSHLAIWGGDQNKVQGNYFGVNDTATALDGTPTVFDAIVLTDGSIGNVIGVDGDGVTDAAERNIIGGAQSGIGIWGSSSTANRIAGNYIGTNASQANLGNTFAGVWVDDGANQNIIGSNNDSIGDNYEGNIVSKNGSSGIVINGAASNRNRISRNVLRNNSYFDLDLGNNGPTPNDILDTDVGPNGYANYPDLSSLTVGATNFVVGGTLSGEASKVYRIEYFATSAAHSAGFGGSQKYLGSANATTNAAGEANFTHTITNTFDYGWLVTATATDSLGNTSEFSAPIWDGVNLTQTFALSSRPTANHTIYLDFTGHTTTGTQWNILKGLPTIHTPAFTIDAAPAFSLAEMLRMQNIYRRVVEDFLPFNVNVTTAEPPIADLIKSGAGDTRWGIRVPIGGAWQDWYGGAAGGVAYINSFNWDSDTPAFVFSTTNYNAADLVAGTISHEVGHALNLSHDGTNIQEYYGGHGSGDTSWNAIMGGGSSSNLTQWSKGEYLNANNPQDDLAIITTMNGFGYIADDYAATLTGAAALSSSSGKILQKGVISGRTDRDYFFFETSGGTIDLKFGVAQFGPNLDLLVRLLNSTGTVLMSNNPADFLTARLATTLAAGRYYVTVDGIGKGNPLTTGYTDYGSLGEYSIAGTISGLNQAPLLANISGSKNYTNNSATSAIFAGTATVSDADSPNFLGGALTISITSGADASNRIILGGTTFTRSGSNILQGATIIGTVNALGGIGTTNLVVTFTANATPAIAQQLIRDLRFRTLGNVNMASRILSVKLTDGDGGTSATLSTTVHIV
jgi:hypothetical protein